MNNPDQTHSTEPEKEASPEVIEAIKSAASCALLEGLSPEHLHILTHCASLKVFRAGDLILQQGTQARFFYLILSGSVALSHAGTKGKVAIQTLNEGDSLGWSWLFPPYSWHFNALAIEPTRTLQFEAGKLRDYCDQRPDFGYQIMRRVAAMVVDRLQKTRIKLFKLSSGF